MRRRGLNELLRTWQADTNGTLIECVVEAMRRVRRCAPARRLPASIESALADERISAWLKLDDVLGQVHQALNEADLQKAYRATNTRKLRLEEIPHVTQLFTPRWIVEFLVQNTLGRKWVAMHPDTKLAANWNWLVLVTMPSQESSRAIRSMRILDPSCGSMNFGLVAIDLLREMYAEELARSGTSGWPQCPSVGCVSLIDESILRHNLFGIDIDTRSLELARLAIELKTGRTWTLNELNLRQADALLDQNDWASFDVIVTNPPYLSARNMPAAMVRKLKANYPHAARDLYACFVERCLQLLAPQGRAGLLTMQSFMFTGSFEKLRRLILSQAGVEALVHLGPGVFDVGNPGTLRTVAFTMSKPSSDGKIAAYGLVESDDKERCLRETLRSPRWIDHTVLQSSPRGAWVYWVNPELSKILRTMPKLRELAPPRQGLATTNNARFVRFWWEVEPSVADPRLRASAGKWFPYAKSGQFRRWYEAPRHRVNWADDGREIKESILSRYPYLKGKWQWVAKNTDWYFKPGVTYSYLTSGRFSARRLDAGAIFDVAGSALFPDEPLTLLGILNSSVAHRLLQTINPTVNFQVGDLAELSVPTIHDEECAALVRQAIVAQKQLDAFDPTSPDFVEPQAWGGGLEDHGQAVEQLHQLEVRIDRRVSELYDIEHVAEPAVKGNGIDRNELAMRWLVHAVARVCAANADGFIRVDAVGILEAMSALVESCGSRAAAEICEHVGGLERFLVRDLPAWLTRTFQRRPRMWVLGSDQRFVVLHDFATPDVLRHVSGSSIDAGSVDDGMIVRLRRIRGLLADRALRKWLENRPT